MSRIDEALRQAAKTDQLPDNWRTGAEDELRPNALESTLEQYAPESPTRPHVSVKHLSQGLGISQPDNSVGAKFVVPSSLDTKLVAGQGISPLIVEQYRRVAAVLHDLQAEQGLKTVMVTSAAPQEGKTLTVANIALTLSESYHQRVLLIDADLRRPSLHNVLGIPNRSGIGDIVASPRNSLPVVQLSHYLSVLTAGCQLANPLATLTSDTMGKIIEEACARFDWVLIDTPPVGLLSDAQLVARLSQGIVFVIAAGVTPYALVQRSITELGAERLVGTILNRVDKRLIANHDYGGYYQPTVMAGLG